MRPGPKGGGGGEGQREEQGDVYGISGWEPTCLQLAREPLPSCSPPLGLREGAGETWIIAGYSGRPKRGWEGESLDQAAPGVSMEMSTQPGILALPVDRVCAQPLYYPTVPALGTRQSPSREKSAASWRPSLHHLPAGQPSKGRVRFGPWNPLDPGQSLLLLGFDFIIYRTSGFA